MTAPGGRRRRRAMQFAVLAAATALGGAVLWQLLPSGGPARSKLSVVLAYASLAALLLTLSVGPVNVLRRRPNPRSTDLRRDLGLWAAATGLIHVVLALGNHFDGSIARYFFSDDSLALARLRRDTFGLGAWSGLGATAILVVLAAISNDRSIRWLGRRWKQVQRGNYALAPLALVHTAFFWLALHRGVAFWMPTILAALLVLAAQLSGVAALRARRTDAGTN